MASNRWVSLLKLVERRRGVVIAVVLGVTALAGLSLFRLRFDNTLDLMLPEGSQAQRLLAFLRDANFSNKIVFSLEERSPSGHRDTLLAAADQLAGLLQPPIVTRVITGAGMSKAVADVGFFISSAPQLLSSNDLREIDAQIAPDGVDRLLKRHYLQLLKPEGAFMARAVQSDPLNLNLLLIGRIEALSANLGYTVNFEQGHFLSADGRHTLVIAETPLPLTDSVAARSLLDYVKSRVALLPSSVKVSVVCGHAHTVSNEDTIKRDLGVIFAIAGLAFVVLYVGYFRDPRALLIFAMPALAAVVGMAVTALIFGRLSYFVLAFGPVIAGIADDYGIAAYVAVRYGKDRIAAIRHIAKPVLVGAVTTTAIFFAFFFSHIPGYYQLAWFCIVSIFLSVALSLLVLPFCVKAGGLHSDGPSTAEEDRKDLHRRRKIVAVCAVLFMALSLALASRLRFDSDVTRLDGTDPAILATEADFQRIWGSANGREAILAVAAPTLEAAREAGDEVYRAASAVAGSNTLVGFTRLWPSRKQREANAKDWTAFWKAGRDERFKTLLQERGATYGFASNAFAPFFDHLYDRPGATEPASSNLLFSTLQDRFVQKGRQGYQVLAFCRDQPDLVNSVSKALAPYPNAYVISRNTVAGILSDSLAREMTWTSAGAALLIVLATILFLRSALLAALALVPAVAGVAGLLALMSLLNMPLNVANLISGIVVFGLCMDFGIHVVHARESRETKSTRTAITFAAATTLIGAGVLLFARHPALYSIGFTLAVGVGIGFVTSLWILPSLCTFLKDSKKETDS